MSEPASSSSSPSNAAFAITAMILLVTTIAIVVAYFSSSCDTASCSTEIKRMPYAEAVDILENVVLKNDENKEKFIKNFFEQIKSTCV